MKPHSLILLLALASCAPRLSYDDGTVSLGNIPVGKFQSTVSSDKFSINDKVAIKDGLVNLQRTFTATEDIDSVRLTLEFEHNSEASFAMIPSVCYNGNNWGRGNEPKGFVTDGICHSYSWRRTPIPGASYSEGKDYAVALWSDVPYSTADDFSVSILPGSGKTIHSLILPEEEMPFVYARRDGYENGYARRLSLRKGESITLSAHLFVTQKLDNHGAMGKFLDKAWEWADKSAMAPDTDPQKIWDLGIRYAKQSLWAEEGPYKGFSIGLLPSGDNGWEQRQGWKYEIGWCGQNASFANSLLTDYLNCGDEESLDKALKTLETWTSDSTVFPSGLYVTNYDNIIAGVQNPVSDACNLGTAARNFFEGSQLLRKCGQDALADKLDKTAYGILDFVMEDQKENGCYGKGWSADGQCVAREGTVGAFLISPMISAYRLSQENKYLDSALKAYDYYMGELRRDGYTTAGALDTWCIDKESSLPVLRAAIELYEINADKNYLADAELAAQYLSTWIWHYRTDVFPEIYNSFGATAVSVQHHHLDPYASLYIPQLLKLSEYTGNVIWKEKSIAIWNNVCQLVSDGTLQVNGRVRPAGSQNEAFFHCNWGFAGQEGSRINNWLVSWPGAFRLEVLRHSGSDWLKH